jgi:hypothetical protein
MPSNGGLHPGTVIREMINQGLEQVKFGCWKVLAHAT